MNNMTSLSFLLLLLTVLVLSPVYEAQVEKPPVNKPPVEKPPVYKPPYGKPPVHESQHDELPIAYGTPSPPVNPGFYGPHNPPYGKP